MFLQLKNRRELKKTSAITCVEHNSYDLLASKIRFVFVDSFGLTVEGNLITLLTLIFLLLTRKKCSS